MKARKFVAAWLVVLLLAASMPQAIAEAEEAENRFFVALNGSDSNTGAEGAPFRTLERARDAIRELKTTEGLPDGGVTVYVREGVYPRQQAFELTEADSGEANAPIVYRAYPGETVRLSGGLELDRTGFEPVTDPAVLARIVERAVHGRVLQLDLAAAGITDYGELSRHGYWKANDVSEVPPMELYIGGQGMTLARWPNEGTVQMDEILDPGPTVKDPDLQQRGGTFSYAYDRPQFWTEAEDIWLDGIFGYSWEWSYNKVAAIDTASKTITLQYGEMSGIFKNWYPDFHFAENLLEELDAPGEYYIDRTQGMLYLMPTAAFLEDQAEATVTMLREPMLRTLGASHIRFDSLVLEYGRDTAAVILGGSDVIIANSEIQNFANGGVLINSPGRYEYDGVANPRDGRDHAVLSSHIRHIGGTAVTLGGGDKDTLEPGNNRVENSHIHDFAYYHKAYNPGVLFSGVGNMASGNEIHDAPHPGIIIYGNDHRIEYNNIYDICKQFQDLGAIYMNAGMVPQERGNVVYRNFFHHIGENLAGVEGVYPDNLTMGLTIEENIFYQMGNSAVKSNNASHIRTVNNMFIDTYIPYDNHEMFMGDAPGNKVDSDYMPAWEALFEANDDFVGTPYAQKYPELLTFFDENHYYPETNTFARNVTYNSARTRSADTNEHGARDVHDLLNYMDNWVADTDPGFVDLAGGDFRLAAGAEVLDRIPGFQPIPFEQIGTQGQVGLPHGPATIEVEAVHFPYDDLTVELGQTAALYAEAVPWLATEPGLSYTSSDPAVASVDADGRVTGLAPGTVVVTAASIADPALTDTLTVTISEGAGILHQTDFEAGGNGWIVDPNHSLVEDGAGNTWYRIVNGANAQHPRAFADYSLTFRLKTPSSIPEGAVLILYDRNGANGSGYVRYRHSAEGSTWVLFGPQWQTLAETPAADLEPDTVYDLRMIAEGASVRVYVNDELVLEGTNPGHSPSGKVGFYVEGWSHLDLDDVTFALPRIAIADIRLSPETLTLDTGESRRLEAQLTPPAAASSGLVWSSDAPAIASVAADGTVRALAAGTAVIRAASRDNPDIRASATVTVRGPQYPVIRLDDHLQDAAQWTVSDAVYADGETVKIYGDGVYGYSGETFGSGLLRFEASFEEMDDGWYGFALRSDRVDDPTWVGANKGYLIVIKADQIEFQSWKPGQTMMEIIPNTAIRPGETHLLEIGAVDVESGTRFILNVDGQPVWNRLDADPDNPIAAAGYLNVYNYAGADNAITLRPSRALQGIALDAPAYTLAPGAARATVTEAVYSDGTREQLTGGVVYAIADPAVATVAADGMLGAVATGETVLTADYAGYTTQASVQVTGDGTGEGEGEGPGTDPDDGSGGDPDPDPDPGEGTDGDPDDDAGGDPEPGPDPGDGSGGDPDDGSGGSPGSGSDADTAAGSGSESDASRNRGLVLLGERELEAVDSSAALTIRLTDGQRGVRLPAPLLKTLERQLVLQSGALTLTFDSATLQAAIAGAGEGDELMILATPLAEKLPIAQQSADGTAARFAQIGGSGAGPGAEADSEPDEGASSGADATTGSGPDKQAGTDTPAGSGPGTQGGTYTLLGAPYKLELRLRSGDVEQPYTGRFVHPVRVVFTLDPDGPPAALDGLAELAELAGIYTRSADGAWGYVGGMLEHGSSGADAGGSVIATELTHFSVYAPLAYTARFTDLGPEHWAYDAVRYAAARHLAEGRADGRFDPAAPMTRAEFAALLVRLLRLEAAPGAAVFADVPQASWYADAVAAAHAAGLVRGRDAERFAPDAPVTRQELAAMLQRAAQLASQRAPQPASGADGSVSEQARDIASSEDWTSDTADASEWARDLELAAHWAIDSIEDALRAGWMRGYPDGRFGPMQPTTRAEALQTLYRFMVRS
ncbi:S-layer homology domain-containing protein [Paenibacillus sp. IB182496]|uniref:S-layer homology domain-containing protein n=1 Tax=Paenibacillus sabuli TaxID=2772509 RepID=A0A927BY02_9BACL|nr:S-layer homology domain-containing protein [Paenibacillus sabuli]MBD2848437.1 S-layer homology domain-containing protein [Paenibacillus sabuli]